MKQKYKISQQLMALILLASLFLQSCGNPLNPVIPNPIQEASLEHIPSSTNHIQPLLNQELTAQGGHSVTFHEQAGQLKADIQMNAPRGFSKTYAGLSVTVEQGAELAKLPCLDIKTQERRIQLQLAKGNQPARIIIYKGAGLVGGGDSEDEEEEEGTCQVGNIPIIINVQDKEHFAPLLREEAKINVGKKDKGKEKEEIYDRKDNQEPQEIHQTVISSYIDGWQDLSTANVQEERYNHIINLFNDEIDKLVEELRSLEGDKKVNYIPTLIYEIGNYFAIDKAIENPTVRSIINKIKVPNKFYLLAEIFEIVLTRNYDSKYLPSIKDNLQEKVKQCKSKVSNDKAIIETISEGKEDTLACCYGDIDKKIAENNIRSNTISLNILNPLLERIRSFIEKYEEEIIDKLLSSAVPVIKKATLNSLNLENCKISNKTPRKPTREFYYSDSEDEDAPHYNGIYNLTKFGILDIDNPDKVYDEFKTSFVENYVTEWKQLLLKGDAAAIHPEFKALNMSNITILCVALRQQEDERIKKFVFTNQPSLMQHEKTKDSLNIIAKLAHKRGYHVIMTQQSHAEAGLIQFLQERPKRYTHIVAMDCSRMHCPLCKKILEDFTEKEILKKVSTSGEADKNSGRWFITQAMKDKEFPCPKPDEIPDNVKIKCKQWGEKEEECHRKLELEEWLDRPWAQGEERRHKVKLRSPRQTSPQKRKIQGEEFTKKEKLDLDSVTDNNTTEQEMRHPSLNNPKAKKFKSNAIDKEDLKISDTDTMEQAS